MIDFAGAPIVMSFNSKLLFFAYANENYYIFVLPYIYFALRSTEDSSVEIILEDYGFFVSKYSKGIEVLENTFPGRFLLRQSSSVEKDPDLKPNVIRFIEEPVLKAEFVYIGDVDILIFEDVLSKHLAFITDYELPFSNVIRGKTELTAYPRLTGLHFAKYSVMYPLPDISDIDVNKRNDENVLYEIMKRKKLMVPLSFRDRPICGIHMSLNRDAVGRYSVNRRDEFYVARSLGWGIRRYSSEFLSAISESGFSRLYFHFSLEVRALLMVVEAESKNILSDLNRIAADFLVDKRLSSSLRSGKKQDLIDEGYSLLNLERYEEARILFHEIIAVWPRYYKGYLGLAFACSKLNNIELAEFLLKQADILTKRSVLKKEVADVRVRIFADFDVN